LASEKNTPHTSYTAILVGYPVSKCSSALLLDYCTSYLWLSLRIAARSVLAGGGSKKLGVNTYQDRAGR
jgi:hypothetical protein